MIANTMPAEYPPQAFWVWHVCGHAVQMVQQYVGSDWYEGRCEYCKWDLMGQPSLFNPKGNPVG